MKTQKMLKKMKYQTITNKEPLVSVNKFKLILFFLVVLVLLISQKLLAQEKVDTSFVKLDTTQVDTIQEMILEEIYIEAVIEKPNVSILPTRVKPEFEDLEFIDRSFKHELKAAPEKLMLLESELETVKKIEKLKKILAKDKN